MRPEILDCVLNTLPELPESSGMEPRTCGWMRGWLATSLCVHTSDYPRIDVGYLFYISKFCHHHLSQRLERLPVASVV
jgi:hypothetical protein